MSVRGRRPSLICRASCPLWKLGIPHCASFGITQQQGGRCRSPPDLHQHFSSLRSLFAPVQAAGAVLSLQQRQQD